MEKNCGLGEGYSIKLWVSLGYDILSVGTPSSTLPLVEYFQKVAIVI